MCGIASIIYPSKGGKFEIESMLNRIKHRGDIAPKFDHFGDSILGMVRLQIVDIPNGDQPIYNETKTIGIVFNGEIYNYKELQAELKAKSHEFKTDCDTEILIHLYEEYGKNFLLKLQGMFAFVLFDKEKDVFWAVRDFYGVKPLFWAKHDSTYYFASEMKAFIDLELDEFHELPPGSFLTNNGEEKYYEFKVNDNLTDSFQTATQRVNKILSEAIKKRVQTDLPIGVFMGGGIDSVIVNILACKYHNNVTSIIIGFEGSEDVVYGIRFCEEYGLQYHYIPITEEELIASLEEVIYTTETFEPNPIRGSVLSILLAKKANELGLKVVICGEGSDEIFAGYGDFLKIKSETYFKSRINELLKDLYSTQLLRIDRTGMRYAVEVREPFLDRELVEYALKIPPSYKVGKDMFGKLTTKLVLREAFKEILPSYIYQRDKRTLMDGAGTGAVDKFKGVLYENALKKIKDNEFDKFKLKYSYFNLNTKEDILNFKIFNKFYSKAKFTSNRVCNAQLEI